MTCREFKHMAASFSLQRLAQQEEPQIMGHVVSCPACKAWMGKQRALNASMHALRTRTAGREAGPDVERALLRVFRQGIPEGRASNAEAGAATAGAKPMPAGVKGPREVLSPHYKAAPRSTPFALQLSRWFEIGAYAAAAAAIAVAIFLGAHLLRHNSSVQEVHSQPVPEKTVPVIQQPVTVASGQDASPAHLRASASRGEAAHRRGQRLKAAGLGSNVADSDDAQSDADAGYMALMLCDPLSCASETQVVRMELPESASAAGQGAQPPVADLVVGYDGTVRAVRWVN